MKNIIKLLRCIILVIGIILFLLSIVAVNAYAQWRVNFGDIVKNDANILSIPVKFEDFNKEASAIQLDIEFDPNKIEFKQVTPGVLTKGFTTSLNVKNNVARIILYNLQNKLIQNGSGSIFNLAFTQKVPISNNEGVKLNIKNFIASTTNAQNIASEAAVEKETALLSIPESQLEAPNTVTESAENTKVEKSPASLANAITPNDDRKGVFVYLYADDLLYPENKTGKIYAKYFNNTNQTLKNVKIKIEIPFAIEVIDKNGGKHVDGVVEWNIAKLEANKTDQVFIEFKAQSQIKGRQMCKITGFIEANGKTESSVLRILCYSSVSETVYQHSKYINGYADNTFRPDNFMTRAETAVIFENLMESGEISFGQNNEKADEAIDSSSMSSDAKVIRFSDISEGFWARKAIENVAKKGLFKGTDEGTFMPDDFITRAEFASVVAHVLNNSQNFPPYNSFLDTRSHWAKGFIEEVFRYSIMKGDPDKSFRPNEQLSRAEAVCAINKLVFRSALKSYKQSFSDIQTNHWASENIQEASCEHYYKMDEHGNEVFLNM